MIFCVDPKSGHQCGHISLHHYGQIGTGFGRPRLTLIQIIGESLPSTWTELDAFLVTLPAMSPAVQCPQEHLFHLPHCSLEFGQAQAAHTNSAVIGQVEERLSPKEW
jgi:hypothetical protein